MAIEKSKSWGPFWSYQLNRTANSAHLAQITITKYKVHKAMNSDHSTNSYLLDCLHTQAVRNVLNFLSINSLNSNELCQILNSSQILENGVPASE